MSKARPARIEYVKMYQVEADHWWYQGLRDVLLYWIKKFKPKKILDAGCGTGINMQNLQQQGYEVYGLDYSQEALQFCRQRGLKNLKLGSIEHLPYADSYFDCIFSLDAIGIVDPERIPQVFKEFHRCLKPNGYLIIHAAAFEFLRSAQDVAWQVKRRYTIDELVDVLTHQGFNTLKATYRVGLLFPLVLLVKFLNKHKVESDTEKTNWLLNNLVMPVMKMEELVLRFVSLPIGSSLFMVARKLPRNNI